MGLSQLFCRQVISQLYRYCCLLPTNKMSVGKQRQERQVEVLKYVVFWLSLLTTGPVGAITDADTLTPVKSGQSRDSSFPITPFNTKSLPAGAQPAELPRLELSQLKQSQPETLVVESAVEYDSQSSLVLSSLARASEGTRQTPRQASDFPILPRRLSEAVADEVTAQALAAENELSRHVAAPDLTPSGYAAAALHPLQSLQLPVRASTSVAGVEALPEPIWASSRVITTAQNREQRITEDPELGILRLQPLGNPESSTTEDSELDLRLGQREPNSTVAEDPELGVLRLRELSGFEDSPEVELGILRLRPLERLEPPEAQRPTPRPTVYLLGRVDYFKSDNIFSRVDPIDDSLIRSGLTLYAAPSIGPQTFLTASVSGSLVRYLDQTDFSYNEQRLNLGIRQVITPRVYGGVGWSNLQLFSRNDGDRFFNEHSFYLEFSRRDQLADRLTLDTFYQLRPSFSNPTNRSRIIHYLGTSLGYRIQPNLQADLYYQFSLADFTQQVREDQYHQLIARLGYRLNQHTQVSAFGGFSFGDSSNSNIDFNSSLFGVSINFNLPLF